MVRRERIHGCGESVAVSRLAGRWLSVPCANHDGAHVDEAVFDAIRVLVQGERPVWPSRSIDVTSRVFGGGKRGLLLLKKNSVVLTGTRVD